MQIKKYFREKLKLIFEGFKRNPHDYKEDIEKLASNMALLQEYNLSQMNARLMEQNKIPKFLEMLTEINFTAGLLKTNKNIFKDNIFYEKERELKNLRPIDLEVSLGSKTYLIQIKSPSKGKRENKTDKLIEDLRRETAKITTKKFFSVRTSRDFSDKNSLPKFIKEKANSSVDNVIYNFPSDKNVQVEVEFYFPLNVPLEHLTLGEYGDLTANEVTGERTVQLKHALKNASGAFDNKTNSKVLNIVVMEVPKGDEIDFCNAIFGTEYYIDDSSSANVKWERHNDGFFKNDECGSKIFGVITLTKKERDSLASSYFHVFSVNPAFEKLLSNIDMSKLLPDIKINFYDTFVE